MCNFTRIKSQKMNSLFAPQDPFKITDNVFKLLDKNWMLLTAGVENDSNSMTASWGGFGILWNIPVVYVFIRPTRYTYEFAEKHENLTISFFTKEYRKALNICGNLSGRHTDKIKEAGLTPMITQSGSVSFVEANMIFDCKKLYFTDITPEHFIYNDIDKHYPLKDYHRMYIYKITSYYQKI
jgi:flavin reductase (DIM6/NTAB) family NADH-FMN oxidoreductase RutF